MAGRITEAAASAVVRPLSRSACTSTNRRSAHRAIPSPRGLSAVVQAAVARPEGLAAGPPSSRGSAAGAGGEVAATGTGAGSVVVSPVNDAGLAMAVGVGGDGGGDGGCWPGAAWGAGVAGGVATGRLASGDGGFFSADWCDGSDWATVAAGGPTASALAGAAPSFVGGAGLPTISLPESFAFPAPGSEEQRKRFTEEITPRNMTIRRSAMTDAEYTVQSARHYTMRQCVTRVCSGFRDLLSVRSSRGRHVARTALLRCRHCRARGPTTLRLRSIDGLTINGEDTSKRPLHRVMQIYG